MYSRRCRSARYRDANMFVMGKATESSFPVADLEPWLGQFANPYGLPASVDAEISDTYAWLGPLRDPQSTGAAFSPLSSQYRAPVPSLCLLLTGACVRCHWQASPLAKLAKLSATRKPHGMSRNGHGYGSPVCLPHRIGCLKPYASTTRNE